MLKKKNWKRAYPLCIIWKHTHHEESKNECWSLLLVVKLHQNSTQDSAKGQCPSCETSTNSMFSPAHNCKTTQAQGLTTTGFIYQTGDWRKRKVSKVTSGQIVSALSRSAKWRLLVDKEVMLQWHTAAVWRLCWTLDGKVTGSSIRRWY